jgi:opacity protein-like surface antigen
MKKFFVGFVSVLALSSPVLAADVGPLPVTALRGTGLIHGCALFQVGSAGPWYAIRADQQGFEQNFSLLLTSATTGQQVTFTLSGQTVCGDAQAAAVMIGVAH